MDLRRDWCELLDRDRVTHDEQIETFTDDMRDGASDVGFKGAVNTNMFKRVSETRRSDAIKSNADSARTRYRLRRGCRDVLRVVLAIAL